MGVIAGLLGTSVIVLIVVFCCLRQRQKRLRRAAESSLTPVDSSSKSSLYISPIEEKRLSSSSNAIYQLPDSGNMAIDHQTRHLSNIYRSDSFRRAIQSGQQQRVNSIIEHVSTKRDSLVETISNRPADLIDPSYSNLEYLVSSPALMTDYSSSSSDSGNENFYQVMNSSASPKLRTYAV